VKTLTDFLLSAGAILIVANLLPLEHPIVWGIVFLTLGIPLQFHRRGLYLDECAKREEIERERADRAWKERLRDN
jgi:hypothetical protein